MLYPDRVSDIRVTTDEGATVRGQLTLSASSTIAATITVEGLPSSAARVEADLHSGAFEIGDLPPGPTRLLVEHRGDPKKTLELMLAPGEVATPMIALPPFPASGRSTCEPCAMAHDCASSACYGGRFAGGVFEEVCLPPCATDGSCEGGFSCIATPHSPTGHLCIPAAATCGALLDLFSAQSCFEDDSCSVGGGLCRDGACTITCHQDGDCPGGRHCVPDPAGGASACR
jgi:hypothetical protein